MNDFELESELKAVRVPARTDGYWEDFPPRVRAQLRRPVFAEREQRSLWAAWSGGLAMACVILGLSLWPAFHAVLKNERVFRHELARLPNQLRLLMADEHGMQYLIAERQ